MSTDPLKRTLPRTLGLALLVVVLLAVADSSAAQDPLSGGETRTQLAAEPPNEPIQPLSGLRNIPLDVTYVYQEGGASLVTTAIEVEVTDRPSWASVSVTPSTVYVPVRDGEGGQGTVTTNLVVQVNADAPAYQQGTIELTASARRNGNLGPSQGTTTIPIQAGFYSVLDAQTPRPLVVAGPQDVVEFPVTVSNFGNGDQTVTLSISQGAEDLDIVLPGTFTTPSKVAGGETNTRTVTVTVQTAFRTGYINAPGTFSLDVSSAYALDQSEEGMSTRISALVTTKGFYVPGPAPGLAAAVLAGVALAGRRWR